MGIVNKIATKLGLAPAETYMYQCDGCGERFESNIPSPALVECPECGQNRPSTVTDNS